MRVCLMNLLLPCQHTMVGARAYRAELFFKLTRIKPGMVVLRRKCQRRVGAATALIVKTSSSMYSFISSFRQPLISEVGNAEESGRLQRFVSRCGNGLMGNNRSITSYSHAHAVGTPAKARLEVSATLHPISTASLVFPTTFLILHFLVDD